MKFRNTTSSTAVLLMTAGLAACGGSDHSAPSASAAVSVGDTVALTASSKLVSFNRATPGTLVGSTTVSGLTGSETLVGIVGPLGVDIGGSAAFDIGGGSNGLALAALRTGTTGPFSLYSVSLTTGAATLYRALAAGAAQIGGAAGPALIDLAITF